MHATATACGHSNLWWSNLPHQYIIFLFRRRFSKPLYEIGPWLSDNEVGIAKVRRRGVSVVETKKGKGYGGNIWVYLNTRSDNFDLCWPGPGFVVFVTQQFCFSGYKNLKKCDKQGTKGMEVGRSGDFSTSSTKGK